MKKELDGIRRASSANHQVPGRRQVTSGRSFPVVTGAAHRRRARAAAGRRLRVRCLADAVDLGRWHKPGAAIFPIAVGLLMAIAAISVLLERHGGADDPMPRDVLAACRRRSAAAASVMGAFAIYFLAMPLLGNLIASALFLLATMWLLSDDPDKSTLRLVALRGGDRAYVRGVLRAAAQGADARTGLKQWLF